MVDSNHISHRELSISLTVEENANKLVLALHCLSDLVCLDVRVICADVRAMHEAETEELVGAVEHCLAHADRKEIVRGVSD